MAATPITTADAAEALDTTPRTLRKFLRADAKARGTETPGKGSRYSLKGDAKSLAAMKKRFIAWSEAEAAKRAETDNEVEETE